MSCQNSYLQKISRDKNYSSYYIQRIFGMKCLADMSILELYPNAKEVTESYGCFEAVVNNFNYDLKDPNVNIVCVGDGHTPRTAAMFAFRSRWATYSIDPELRSRTTWNRINRLKRISKRIQEVSLEFEEPTIIVHCHAHVKIEDSLRSIKSPELSVVSMECCVGQYIRRIEPDIVYKDNCIWTPKNEIKIWKNVSAIV